MEGIWERVLISGDQQEDTRKWNEASGEVLLRLPREAPSLPELKEHPDNALSCMVQFQVVL